MSDDEEYIDDYESINLNNLRIKKGNKLEELVFTLEYDEVNATLVQEFKYSNFKKFEKSSEGSHKKDMRLLLIY